VAAKTLQEGPAVMAGREVQLRFSRAIQLLQLTMPSARHIGCANGCMGSS
jgi:hypothetical protein